MHTLLKLLLATSLAFSATIANAAFINTTSGAGYNSGSFNEAVSSGFLLVSGGDDKGVRGDGYSQLEDTFASAGVFSFDWAFGRSSNAASGGYLLNGTKVELAFTDDFFNRPSGSTSVTLAAGDTFGWYLEAFLSGASSESLFNLSNASFSPSPSAVPVPAAAWLFGSALLGVAGLRRKQHA